MFAISDPLSEQTCSMQTRELVLSDREGAIALWHATELTRPWNDPAEDFDRAVASPESTVLGGFEKERMVATVMVGHDGHRGWVYYLAVDQRVRGRGLGSQMMSDAEAWLRGSGTPKLNLMVRTSNAAALRFYERLGYEDDDVTVLSRWLT
jgi:ribosomal protein S18 acetylase RimI-like enzyme